MIFRRKTEARLRSLIEEAQAERAALLRTLDEAVRARREVEDLNKRMFVNFMTRIQQVRREARIALEEIHP